MRFIKRHAVAILFVIVMVALALTYRRQENLIEENRTAAVRAKELAVLVARQDVVQQKALCYSRVEARANLAELLISIVDDFIPSNRPARAVLERRINDYLGEPPEDCS